MTNKLFAPAALAAALVGGAALLAPAPVAAQSQQDQSSGDGRGGGRDYFRSNDPMDSYDRYLRRLREDRAQDDGRRGGGAGGRGSGDRSGGMERYARDQFERGYQAGREEERRRRASQQSGDDGRSSSSSAGRGRDFDRYYVIPDVLPDTRRYRGMQDFALIPDYSQSMDWLLVAAQSLREAVQAMAQEPSSDRRNRAMDLAREALLDTQQAMVQLPPELRNR